MECTVNWMPASGMAFSAETGSGHLITMDGAPDGGGRNLAPRPMETVLAGTGGCTAYDVVLILKRGRHDVRGCQVKLHADRAAQAVEGAGGVALLSLALFLSREQPGKPEPKKEERIGD